MTPERWLAPWTSESKLDKYLYNCLVEPSAGRFAFGICLIINRAGGQVVLSPYSFSLPRPVVMSHILCLLGNDAGQLPVLLNGYAYL